MIAVLAHQGGWDEILIPVLAVLTMLGLARLRRRRATTTGAEAPDAAAEPRCEYCDAVLPADARRCPSCGFRVPAG
ncbi:MAG TPA: hypothetical protein VFQ40_01850 [Actinomycetota bacterium]|nr:hypothetical protein [Actinomycetota bacterium]